MVKTYAPSAADVKALREATNAPVMDCRKALAESGGDFEKAKKLLAERGQQLAAKKSEREVHEGFIGHYIHQGGKMGVLVELAVRNRFRSEERTFQKLAHDLAVHICASRPLYVRRDDIPEAYAKQGRRARRQSRQVSTKKSCCWSSRTCATRARPSPNSCSARSACLARISSVRRFARFDIGES